MRRGRDLLNLASEASAAILLVALAVGAARADAVADCNDAADPRVRIDGCTAVIETEPAPEILAVALMNRGIGWAANGDLDQALADLDAALEASPGLPGALYNRGNVMMDRDKPEKAIADFSAVIEDTPDFALAWLNRGLARERLRDKAGARRDFAKALELDESLDAAQRGLARTKRAR